MPNAVANQLAALIRDSIPPPESRCNLNPLSAALVHSLSISSYTNESAERAGGEGDNHPRRMADGSKKRSERNPTVMGLLK